MLAPRPSSRTEEREHRAQLDQVTSVPVYPVVRLELRELTGGLWSGLANGITVCDQADEQAARVVLLAQAAQAASLRPGGAIRVVAEGFNDETSDFVVTADGQMTPTGAPNENRSRRRVTAVASGIVAVVAAAGVTLTMVARAAPSHPRTAVVAPSASATQLPVVPPPGYGAVAAWAAPVSFSGADAVATADGLVFAPNADASGVVALDAGTGVRRWQGTLAGGSLGTPATMAGGPVVVGSGAAAMVMAWSVDHVAAWSATSGAAKGEWPLPAAAQVVAYPLGVVAVGQGQHASVFTSSGMTERVIPAGAVVAGVTGDGGVVTVGDGRAWLVTSDAVAGDGVPLTAPRGTTVLGPLGVAHGVLVMAYSNPSGDAVLTGFRVGTWRTAWSVDAGPATGFDTTSTGQTVSPALLEQGRQARWAIAGTELMDASGRMHPLPAGWVTTAISDQMAFGTTSSGLAVAYPDGRVTSAASSGTATPVAPVAVDDAGHLFVVANDGDRTSLYALQSTGSRR